MIRKLYVVIIVLLLSTVIALDYFVPEKELSSSSNGLPAGVNSVILTSITYNNLPSELSSNEVVKDLPEDATILLKFYNFNSGAREWERSFTITRGKIVQGGTEGDIILSIHSKYLSGMSNQNFCSVIQKANVNRDLGFETEMSKAALAWKYRSVMEHKSCFGL